MTATEQLRVLSWNVHGFIGRTGVPDPAAVIHAVREFDADIVALQEIDERRLRSAEAPAFARLREVFGEHGAEARTIRTEDGDYGHALISRWPVIESSELDLSVRRREPRIALSARIAAPSGVVHVIAAHLGLSARERRRQVAIIRAQLPIYEDPAAIVLGDFNEWRRRGVTTRSLCPPFVPAADQASFPAAYPLLALDRIWCRPPLRVVAGGTVTAFRHLSDHLPVFADLARDPEDNGAAAGAD